MRSRLLVSGPEVHRDAEADVTDGESANNLENVIHGSVLIRARAVEPALMSNRMFGMNRGFSPSMTGTGTRHTGSLHGKTP